MSRDELIEAIQDGEYGLKESAAALDLILGEVDRQVGEIHKASFAGKGTTGIAACEECFRPWPCPTSVVLAKLAKPPEPTPLPESPWAAYAAMVGVKLPAAIG